MLTPAAFVADFNADGQADLATVAFTADFKIRTSFRLAGQTKVTSVDVPPAGGAYVNRLGGGASIELVSAASAGLGSLTGGLVLLGYAVVLLVLGYVFSWRRDVT